MLKKKCRLCLKELPLESFSLRGNYRDGSSNYRNECKCCLNEIKGKKRREKAKLNKTFNLVAGTKICNMCETKKELYKFSNEKSNKTDGKRGRCKVCEKVSKQTPDRIAKRRVAERLRYANLSVEDKKKHIAKKSLGNTKRFKTNPEALKKRKLYGLTDKGIFTRYKNDAKKGNRNYTFALTFSEFSNIINSDCFYCGTENCRGCDRVDNTKGYSVENCVPSCRTCNEIKMTRSVDDLYSHIRKMANHFNKNKKVITDRFAPK